MNGRSNSFRFHVDQEPPHRPPIKDDPSLEIGEALHINLKQIETNSRCVFNRSECLEHCLPRMDPQVMGPTVSFGNHPQVISERCSVQQDSDRSSIGSEVYAQSMDQPLTFQPLPVPVPERCSVQQDSDRSSIGSEVYARSMDQPLTFQPLPVPVPERELLRTSCLESWTNVEMKLKEHLWALLTNQMSRLHADHFSGQDQVPLDQMEEDEQEYRDLFLKIVLKFLRKENEVELANCLQSKSPCMCQTTFKKALKQRCLKQFQAINKEGNLSSLEDIYTELDIVVGETETVKSEDLFKAWTRAGKPNRTVLTEGVACIGKTSLTQKVTLDWIQSRAHQDIHFMFPFTFRELNTVKKGFSRLEELIHHFFPEVGALGHFRLEDFRVVFILDGLDECRFPLEFHECLHDDAKPASVGSLLTKVIKGEVLPSAHVWITSRPAASSRIPPRYIDMLTEVRGFTDQQKEEYFRKRFRSNGQLCRIMSHIENSQSVYIMCHIPIFCWITATVLEYVLHCTDGKELPDRLTDMYIHFLTVQTRFKNLKYDGGNGTDGVWNAKSRSMVQRLGKVAYEQLKERSLMLCESDLTECGVDVTAATVCSGVFMQISEETRLIQKKLFRFIHLSVQEFLASLHVHLTFFNSGINLLEEEAENHVDCQSEERFYRSAVDLALKSPDRNMDLFVRFLLGLSQSTNQRLLQGFLGETKSSGESDQKIIRYIKSKFSEAPMERSNHLFYCLMELKDQSLVEETQRDLESGCLSAQQLNPAQWSALTHILLSQKTELEVFDLRKYCASEDAVLQLLAVIKASRKAVLSGCNLTDRSCEALSSVLSSSTSCLEELDLSNNDLRDSGVKLLAVGLQSPTCKLKVLRLSGCVVTKEGWSSLVPALTSNQAMKELDMSYNHLGEDDVKDLRLRMFPSGFQWLKPGLNASDVQLDPNTAPSVLLVYDNNRKVETLEEPQVWHKHADSYKLPMVRGKQGLMGRCYWEVQWEGSVTIAVTYKVQASGHDVNGFLGFNQSSWALFCTAGSYRAVHNQSYKEIYPPTSVNRIGVYLDQPAGTLSFYNVSTTGWQLHLHTFYINFTDSVYPAFGFWSPKSSISICELLA